MILGWIFYLKAVPEGQKKEKWARNKAKVLIEQLVVLSIHLSKHNILSTYDGDHICWHVMFGHRIESL